MNTSAAEKEWADLLESNTSFDMMLQAIRRFKDSGGTQEGAYQALYNIMRTITDEKKEDTVLKLLDYVTGFCPLEKQIWKKRMDE